MMHAEIVASLEASQAAFLSVLSNADNTTLYRRDENDEWTLAEILVHMAEARTFYANEIDRLRQNPDAMIGRDLTHEGRTRMIVEHGNDSSAEIRAHLTQRHALVLSTLSKLTDADLTSIVGDHEQLGQKTIGEFIGRYLVGHNKMHVEQAQTRIK